MSWHGLLQRSDHLIILIFPQCFGSCTRPFPPNTLPAPDLAAHQAQEIREDALLRGILLDLDWFPDPQHPEHILFFFPLHLAPHISTFDFHPDGSFFTTTNLRQERALIRSIEVGRRPRRRRRVFPYRQRSPGRDTSEIGIYPY